MAKKKKAFVSSVANYFQNGTSLFEEGEDCTEKMDYPLSVLILISIIKSITDMNSVPTTTSTKKPTQHTVT